MHNDLKRGNSISEIAFIVCTNDEGYLEECKFYIERLYVPEGMTVSFLAVEETKSMTSGYNEAMRSSDARYKVYLHQDVFILNRNFIFDILACFECDENLGMIGVAGAKRLPSNADAWKSLDVGGCYSIGTFSDVGYIAVRPEINNPADIFQEVDFIDGMLMATAYDLEWDERIGGFHFYDVTQCINFKSNDLKIAVARQNDIWTFHDFGPLNLETYNANRRNFCELYAEFEYEKGDVQDNTQIYQMCNKVVSALIPLFEQERYRDIKNILRDIDNAIYFSQDLLNMYFIMEIYTLENMIGIDSFMYAPTLIDNAYECLGKKYCGIKWMLTRAIFAYESAEQIVDMITDGTYSMVAVIVAILHSVPLQNIHIVEEISAGLVRKGFRHGEWENTYLMVEEYERENVPSARGL